MIGLPLALRFVVYGALGWCAEIIWTAVRKRVTNQSHDWLLMGETSLWSFLMYGSMALVFEPVHNLLRPQFILLRAFVYLLGFWTIEYIGGWLVWKITGTKPWDYSKSPGGSLNGLIRWNFVLVWPWFGLLMELIHNFLIRLSFH